MATGKIGVSTQNLFPIIKKFLYSDHEIFLREIVSNAVDATQKLKVLASSGEFKGEASNLRVRVKADKEAGTLTVSDSGIGMTREEVEKYINQIAFSGAEEFLEKHKDDAATIIGHFGLGFYSAFMVSDKVEIVTKSYKEGAQAVKWTGEGDTEYTLENTEKAERGTDIIMYINAEEKDFLEENKLQDLLTKYCKFLPIEIVFGKKKEWKDGKYVDTEEDNIINDTNPLWTRKPSELKEEDYQKFYRELYPMAQDPLFHIHLNVDYPFNLTGILYFPKIDNKFEIQKNKIQLYSNQVYVSDSVEGIVPEYLTLLHGVIDSPDIPLNVSRSYLQSDSNVKKISGYITKKVSERLQEIFNSDRKQFEEKWDDLKIFIEYGMLSDEKFYERAQKFVLLKDTEDKYYTLDEYKKLIEGNQTDKDGQLVYLYATDKEAQYSYIDTAVSRGYDVLLMNGQLDPHFIGMLEQKLEKSRFVRVDSDLIDKLIKKSDTTSNTALDEQQRDMMTSVFKSQIPAMEKSDFLVMFEPVGATAQPIVITQNEFMRRMKDMAAIQSGMAFYGELPDSYNLIVNTDHPLSQKVIADTESACKSELTPILDELKTVNEEIERLQEAKKDKKDDEIPVADKEALKHAEEKAKELRAKESDILKTYADQTPLVRQLVDLALLSNNMLKGEALSKFIKRSVEML